MGDSVTDLPTLTVPRLGRVRNVDRALAQHGDRVNVYVEAMSWADPLADAFAEDCALIGRGRGMNMFNQVIVDGMDVNAIPDAPASLKALVAQIETVPFWVDMNQIDLGAAAYSRHAREAGIALGTASLVSGYYNSAAARPLMVTGRFVDMAKMRSLETSMWVFATARPGGLHRHGAGFIRTARVRMIHAFVRQHILTKVDWDIQEYGIPINQADLAFTAVEFSLLPIRAMQQLGVHFSSAEVSAMYAMWRYMGYLMGVDERILMTNQAEAERLADLQHTLSPPPDDECRAFVKALFDELALDLQQASGPLGLVGRHWGNELLNGLARDFVGDEIADGLRIERTRWRHVPSLTYPIMNVTTRARALVPALQRRKMRRSLAEVDQVLAATAREMGVSHDLVDQSTGHPAST